MTVTIEALKPLLSVCKLEAGTALPLDAAFCFVGKTDQELSLVCPTERVPPNTLAREDGWRAFRVAGPLDFSLVGILAGLSTALREAGISIFALSTYDTDYILVKEERFSQALGVLEDTGCRVYSDMPK